MIGLVEAEEAEPKAPRVDPTNSPSLPESTRLTAYMTVKKAKSSVMKSA
jgi:hypothetical protein